MPGAWDPWAGIKQAPILLRQFHCSKESLLRLLRIQIREHKRAIGQGDIAQDLPVVRGQDVIPIDSILRANWAAKGQGTIRVYLNQGKCGGGASRCSKRVADDHGINAAVCGP